MYVEIGKQLVRIRLSRKELAAVAGLVATAAGYVYHTELALAHLRGDLAVCLAEVQRLQNKPGVNYTAGYNRSSNE